MCCPSAGARLMWGGKPLEGHSIPEVYGAMQPTAVFVPLDAMLESDANWELCNTELFGPFQVPRRLSCMVSLACWRLAG
jgi:1-pyrroline-5-carboxylate dehydrogenase